MTDRNRPQAVFRKSTYSDAAEGCVEAAMLDISRLVRESKDPDGPMPVDDTRHGKSNPTELLDL